MKTLSIMTTAFVLACSCTKSDRGPATQELTSGPVDAGWVGHGVGSAGALGTNRVETPTGGFRGAGAGPDVLCASADEPLGPTTLAAIERALAGERAAEARYEAAVASLGHVAPLRQLEAAERRHAAALEALLERHHAHVMPVALPPSPEPASLREACASAAESERKNVALYDELLQTTGLPADVRCVFAQMRSASRDRHLPRLERCARLR